MTYFKLGPTELRILLAAGNIVAFFKPTVTIAGQSLLWLDAAGVGMAIGLALTLLYSIWGNTSALYKEERLAD